MVLTLSSALSGEGEQATINDVLQFPVGEVSHAG
jgi:hypothetical protein